MVEDPAGNRHRAGTVSNQSNPGAAAAFGRVCVLRVLAMPLTGGFAALLLATLPGFFTFSRSSLSEVSASLLIVLAFMFAHLGVKEERRWKIYLSAVNFLVFH